MASKTTLVEVVAELHAEVSALRVENEALRVEMAALKKKLPSSAVSRVPVVSLVRAIKSSSPPDAAPTPPSITKKSTDAERRKRKAEMDRERRKKKKKLEQEVIKGATASGGGAQAAVAPAKTKRKRDHTKEDAPTTSEQSTQATSATDSIDKTTMATLLACEQPMDVVHAVEHKYPQCRNVYASADFWTRWKAAHAECPLSTTPNDIGAMVAAFHEESTDDPALKHLRTASVISVPASNADGMGHDDDVATQRDGGLGFVHKIHVADHDD